MHIGLDIDGVLCDHVRGLKPWILARYGIRVEKKDVAEWDFHFGPSSVARELEAAYRDSQFVLGLPAMKGARSGVHVRRKRHELTILTGRPTSTRSETAGWVRARFGDLPLVFVSGTKSVPEVDALVDDFPGYVMDFAAKCGRAILFDQPWNRNIPLPNSLTMKSKLIRCENWKAVVDTIDRSEEAGPGEDRTADERPFRECAHGGPMTLTFDDLRRLVAQSEDAHVELKEQPSDQVLREFSTDIASVANGKGGAFIFGVTNAKELVGCELTGGERERISQEAAKCRPPVQIEFDEAVAEDGKRFLVVYVPVATTLPHSDFRDKTPVRVGNITAYLDASGVVGWLNERGLLRREPAESSQSYAETKREPISDEEALAIAAGLNSGSSDARLEALRDLAHLSHRRVVLDRKELAAPTGGILLRGPLEHVKLILEALRSVVLWGTVEEKRPVVEWFVRITELARGLDNPEIARMAFDVLQCAHRGEAADVLAEWVTKADDKTWSALAASHQLGNVRFYGLDRPMRAAMHRILEGTPPDTVKLRVSEVLEALRRAYG